MSDVFGDIGKALTDFESKTAAYEQAKRDLLASHEALLTAVQSSRPVFTDADAAPAASEPESETADEGVDITDEMIQESVETTPSPSSRKGRVSTPRKPRVSAAPDVVPAEQQEDETEELAVDVVVKEGEEDSPSELPFPSDDEDDNAPAAESGDDATTDADESKDEAPAKPKRTRRRTKNVEPEVVVDDEAAEDEALVEEVVGMPSSDFESLFSEDEEDTLDEELGSLFGSEFDNEDPEEF